MAEHDRLITSDSALTAAQRELLRTLLDTIIPLGDDGTKPSAGDIDFLPYVEANAADFLLELGEILGYFDADFAHCPLMVRYERVKAFSETVPDSFDRLLSEVYACYYQDARVLEAIGAGIGPPFPRGNTVEPSDLSLLDPVSKNKTTWRRTR